MKGQLVIRFGGLWEKDLPQLIQEGESKGYEVSWGLEIDNYHYWVKYEGLQ